MTKLHFKTVAFQTDFITRLVDEDISFLKDQVGAFLYQELKGFLSIILQQAKTPNNPEVAKSARLYPLYISQLREYSKSLKKLDSLTIKDIRTQLNKHQDHELEFFTVRKAVGADFLYGLIKDYGVKQEDFVAWTDLVCLRQFVPDSNNQLLQLLSKRDNLSSETIEKSNQIIPGLYEQFQSFTGNPEYYLHKPQELSYLSVIPGLIGNYLPSVQQGVISFWVHTHPLKADLARFKEEDDISSALQQGEHFSGKDLDAIRTFKRPSAVHSERGFSFIDPYYSLSGEAVSADFAKDKSTVVNREENRCLRRDILLSLHRMGVRGGLISLTKILINLYKDNISLEESLAKIRLLSIEENLKQKLISLLEQEQDVWAEELGIKSFYRQVISADQGFSQVHVTEKALKSEISNISEMSLEEAHEYLVLKRSNYLRDFLCVKYGLDSIFFDSDSIFLKDSSVNKKFISPKASQEVLSLYSMLYSATDLDQVREIVGTIQETVSSFYLQEVLYQ